MTGSDKRARQIVAKLFMENVPSGNVLDFGGGTGLDISWLNHNNYYIYFIEPSIGMREVAKEKNSSIHSGLNFIDKNVNFSDWEDGSLPFEEKMDGVLANFAVLNCIEDIQPFFEKISMIAGKSCKLIITIIDPRFKMILKNYSAISAFRILVTGKLNFSHKYKGIYHETYIHPLKSIRKASLKYFKIEKIMPLEFSTFTVLVFAKI